MDLHRRESHSFKYMQWMTQLSHFLFQRTPFCYHSTSLSLKSKFSLQEVHLSRTLLMKTLVMRQMLVSCQLLELIRFELGTCHEFQSRSMCKKLMNRQLLNSFTN